MIISRRHGQRGFTLTEVLIAVAIIGILAAIALPSYSAYVQKARRTDAKEALLRIQLEQERWRANNASYAGKLVDDLGWSEAKSAEGHYSLALSDASATSFTATATAIGIQAKDTSCKEISLTYSAGTLTKKATSSDCWK